MTKNQSQKKNFIVRNTASQEAALLGLMELQLARIALPLVWQNMLLGKPTTHGIEVGLRGGGGFANHPFREREITFEFVDSGPIRIMVRTAPNRVFPTPATTQKDLARARWVPIEASVTALGVSYSFRRLIKPLLHWVRKEAIRPDVLREEDEAPFRS